MSSEFVAARKIPWPRPQGCPSQFETKQVFTGNDEGDLALEVGIAEWSGEGPPSREAFLKLHKARAGQGINPVVIVATAGEKAWLFGPNSQAAVVGPLAIDHAQRLIQTALNESSGLAARQSLNQTYEAISATSTGGSEVDALRGVGNAGLFATHELRHGVRNRVDWNHACLQSKEMMGLRKDDLVKKLGYSLENVGGHASLLRSKGANPRAAAVILLDHETFDGQSSRFAISPVASGIGIAQTKEVAWLIVLRKDAIRLYPARLDLGVGRKGLSETYFELNLSVADETTAGFLSLIFSSEALAENGSCYEILKSSAQYAVGLSERLRDNVYGEIVPRLALSVASQFPKLGVVLDRDGLNLAYQITLRIFFRMLFQAYADDRKLLPFGENADYTRNAIKGFAKKFVEEDDIEFDDESTSYWDDLIQVWHAIDTGSKRFGIPAYNGGLFSSDEELQPEGALIEKLRITDDVMGPVLRALLIDTGDDGNLGPIDFRSLSVREFGTIYEGLLESNLGVADTDLVLDDNDTWVPATKGAKLEPGRSAKKGTVYFHDTSGARKGTGSYFTPSFVVEHLLERSLDPSLDLHLERVKQVIEKGDQVGAADLFFDFKVADLAMGSAHFLTAAIDHIEQRMASFLDAHPIPGVTNELRRLEEAAREKLGENASVPEPSSLLRRQIARRCIYGLDINPVAVELARVSIWIHTFVRGLPMSSLDHTLVCANSLTGIGTVEEALNVLVPGRKGGQLGIFDAPIEDALTKARDVLIEVARALELDSKESKAASRASMKAFKDAKGAKLLFDAAVLIRIGRGGLVAGADPASIAKMASEDQAQVALAPLQPAHMPLLFPEVFLRDNGGFDVLIGNPPWEGVHVREDHWWNKRIPGLQGMTPKDRDKRISRARLERPELAQEFDLEVESKNIQRTAIMAGPYEGLGSGHVDLYQAFAWRNWALQRKKGWVGIVLPRSSLNGSALREWRHKVLTEGSIVDAVILTNSNKWVFESVDGRISFVLMCLSRDAKSMARICGPFFGTEQFEMSKTSQAVLTKEVLLKMSDTLAIPSLQDELSGEIFELMQRNERFDEVSDTWDFKPMRGDILDKHLFSFDGFKDGYIPIFGGASFHFWNPDFGNPYAYAAPVRYRKALHERIVSSAKQKRSAFHGLGPFVRENLYIDVPRIAIRWISKSNDTRTCIACLLPPTVGATDSASVLVRKSGTQITEAFLLGVLSSIIFDWYIRKWVEQNLTFELLKPTPVPRSKIGSLNGKRLIEISGSLAAVDKRFSKWAKAVGVPVGSVKTPEEREELEIELDALVAHLYGLSREHVAHVYKTFHRGWVEHAPRLVRVLTYYDKIAKANK